MECVIITVTSNFARHKLQIRRNIKVYLFGYQFPVENSMREVKWVDEAGGATS